MPRAAGFARLVNPRDTGHGSLIRLIPATSAIVKVMDYDTMTDVELCARMAERFGFRFEANNGGTAFRMVDLELDTLPWRSSLEEAWKDAPNFIKKRWLWDQPEILMPLGQHAWAYWRSLNDGVGQTKAKEREHVIAFLKSVTPSPRF